MSASVYSTYGYWCNLIANKSSIKIGEYKQNGTDKTSSVIVKVYGINY